MYIKVINLSQKNTTRINYMATIQQPVGFSRRTSRFAVSHS